MNYNLTAYFIYSILTIYTIIYVGRTLHKNGRHFIVQLIKDESISDFINNGLLVGYYLVNIGYVLISINQWETINTGIQLIELLCKQTGTIFLILGVLHHSNILILKIYSHYTKAKTPT